jgi:4-carboxymuconolactone decarboxylase
MPSKELRDSLRSIFGDVAPKLAELTETVVFDDIWERTA